MARISRWFYFVTSICLSCALPLYASADPLADMERAQQALFDKAAASVVYIGASGSFGSGFAVGDQGFVLTNAHVVNGHKQVQVVTHDGQTLEGAVVERGEDGVDLALVQVKPGVIPPLEIGATSELRVGSWVAAIGHGAGGIWTFTTGMVTNLYPLSDANRDVIQTQIPINPGNSGGPMLDRRGRTVGVNTAILKGMSNVAFGLRLDLALRSLAHMADACTTCLTVRAPAGVPILIDGQMAGKGRVIIFADKPRYEVMAVVAGVMYRQVVEFPKVRTVQLGPTP